MVEVLVMITTCPPASVDAEVKTERDVDGGNVEVVEDDAAEVIDEGGEVVADADVSLVGRLEQTVVNNVAVADVSVTGTVITTGV